MSFEWDYVNVLTLLKLAGVPLYASERTDRHPLVVIGEMQRRATRVDPGPDRDDAIDARRPRTRDQRLRVVAAGVEVRVRVDHATGASASMRGKSGGAGTMPRAASAAPGRTRSHARSSGWPSARRIRGAVSGM